MHVIIVVVNYCSPKLVVDCLASLAQEVRGLSPEIATVQVVVVDNASGDGSADLLATEIKANEWNSWATVIGSPVNGGFSAGNNLGINALDGDAYLLLNSDTLVREGGLTSLVDALTRYPEAGILGPRLEWPDGRPQVSAFRYRSPISELIGGAQTGPITRLFGRYDVPLGTPDEPIDAEWLSFAAVLIRREVIDEIGLMDEGYFMYFEDIDYCRRAAAAGWRIVHWPQARVVHLRGGSSDVKKKTESRQRRPRYYYASRSRYLAKFYGHSGLVIANLAWHFGRCVAFVRETIGNKPPHVCQTEWLDNWTNGLNPLAIERPPAGNTK